MTFTTRQKDTLNFLLDAVPGFAVNGFKTALVSAVLSDIDDPENFFGHTDKRQWAKELKDTFDIPYMPDGFVLDAINRDFHWYEVDATHKTRREKLINLAWTNDILCGYGWGISFHLLTVVQGVVRNEIVIPRDEFWPGHVSRMFT